MNAKLTLGLCLALSAVALLVAAQDASSDGLQSSGAEFMEAQTDSMKSVSRHANEATYEEEQPNRKDPFYQASEYAKLMLNPIALIKKISHDFNLPKNKLIEKVGKGLVFGAEALFSPVIACIKIIEKVFMPDACRLKFVCQFGSRLDFMKETMLKFSPNFVEGSAHVKALSYGILGRDCAQTFADCEPTLHESYKDLKEPQQQQYEEEKPQYA